MKIERVTNLYRNIGQSIVRFLAPNCICCAEKVVEKAGDKRLLREGTFAYEERRFDYQIPPFINQGIIEEYSFSSGAALYQARGWMFVSRLALNGYFYLDIREYGENLIWCGPCYGNTPESSLNWLEKIGANFGEDALRKLNQYRQIDPFAVCFPILQGSRR